MKRIEKVMVVRTVDTDADISTLGEYTSQAGDGWVIVREGERAGWYVANLGAEALREKAEGLREEAADLADDTNVEQDKPRAARMVSEADTLDEEANGIEAAYAVPRDAREHCYFRPYAAGAQPGSADYQTCGVQDWKRAEGLERGDWQYIGIRAEATVAVSTDGGKHWLSDTLASGGVWGVESDSGDYLDEVGRDELAELADVLKEYGFGKAQTRKAIAAAETVDR